MPKVSRESATKSEEVGPVKDRFEIIDGYSVNFTAFEEDIDATPLLKGLPGDRCQCPHWGYVFKGTMTVRVGDTDEVYHAGEAFYTPPGHTPLKHEAGTEVIMFSPEAELSRTGAAVRRNAQEQSLHVRTSE
ncbi:cupin domain-containing protein [Micromonospora sp. PLK6-60]|uniref:cupin domain-containing protein n=1 Tax=Micromonospora sp. PLK6-60 TaxID=2873383 RepID=UPI001CA6108C|nr:cupin domain-containing protein [Micromonospora sp. PLK6-60]MBY8870765.1 cupin domain-containing protein [Micromonospora sp. PLK6-60]